MEIQIAALAADEEHTVMWDIDALIASVSQTAPLTIPTSKLIPQQWLTIDKEYAKTTDVTKPIILFELPGNKAYIADGNHRLYHAAEANIPQMNVILVPEDVHLQYLFRSTRQDYQETIRRLLSEGIFIAKPY